MSVAAGMGLVDRRCAMHVVNEEKIGTEGTEKLAHERSKRET